MIVTSSPSRIQTIPRPITTRQWNFDHGSRSSRAGILVSIVLKPPESAAAEPASMLSRSVPTPAGGQTPCGPAYVALCCLRPRVAT